jgi:hypothetical protein
MLPAGSDLRISPIRRAARSVMLTDVMVSTVAIVCP